MSILKFSPICIERVWGGRRLEQVFGRELPAGCPIGESWEVVDRPEAQSIVAEGPEAGVPLRDLLRRDSNRMLGPGWPPDHPFPILVKWLDCTERLSLQVHPPAEIAQRLGGEAKTENWYLAATDPGANLLVGLRRGVTRDSFESALAEGRLEDLIHRIPATAGDSLLVESGRIHAIDAGNLILEIQQNSDTTYRVYDWERLGLDGKPRDLHPKESLACIDFEDFEPDVLRTDPEVTEQTLAECPHFRIRKLEWEAGQTGELSLAGEGTALLHLVRGELSCGETILGRGETGLIPFSEAGTGIARKRSTFLLTDGFDAQPV